LKKTILVVEDDPEIMELVCGTLQNQGYGTTQAENGETALALLRQNDYEMAILDLMLPIVSGEDVLRELRTFSALPVIVISAKDYTDSKVEMLRIGPDDYVTKPFDIDELNARIEAVLRRRHGGASGRLLIVGSITLDPDAKTVQVAGEPLLLTPKEFGILEALMQNPTKVFSKESLFEQVWGQEYLGDEATLNVHISNLRGKLKAADAGRDYIETLWGLGYRISRGTTPSHKQ